MKQKRTRGWSLHAHRNLKAELAKVRRERNTARRDATLNAMGTDYYRSLTVWFEECILVLARTEEQLTEAKQRYWIYEKECSRRLAEKAKPYGNIRALIRL